MATENRTGHHRQSPARSPRCWQSRVLPLIGATLTMLFVLQGPLAAPVPAESAQAQVERSQALADRSEDPVRSDHEAAGPGASERKPVPKLDAQDLRYLAQLIEAEAGGEPYAGKVAVGAVVLNRVRHPHFPDSVEAVIFEPGQFEPVQNGWFWQDPSPAAWRAARDAARGKDPTDGALYFWNPAKSGYQPYLEERPSAGRIGSHQFAR